MNLDEVQKDFNTLDDFDINSKYSKETLMQILFLLTGEQVSSDAGNLINTIRLLLANGGR